MKDEKRFSLSNSATIVKQYVPRLLDRLIVYDIYFKPCVDLLLFADNDSADLNKIELSLIKNLLNIPITAADPAVRGLSGIPNIKSRTIAAAKSLAETGILPKEKPETWTSITRNGQTVFSYEKASIAERLRLYCDFIPDKCTERPTAKKLKNLCRLERQKVRNHATTYCIKVKKKK